MTENSVSTSEKKWFALYTKPRHEFKAAEQLEDVGIQYYLPTVTKIKQWSDRKKKITEPLINGYIFIKANERERIKALEQNAMVRCITFNGKPAHIPDWQIENLKIMLSTSQDISITEMINTGTRVKITSGPFEGVIGVVNEAPQGRTISITIDLLKRSVTAVLPIESIIKVSDESKAEE